MNIEWSALGQVLVAGLVVGAGIPALFALALRLLAGTTPQGAQPVATTSGMRPSVASSGAAPGAGDPGRGPVAIARPTPARLVGAIVCLGVVVGAVAFGLVVIVSGGH